MADPAGSSPVTMANTDFSFTPMHTASSVMFSEQGEQPTLGSIKTCSTMRSIHKSMMKTKVNIQARTSVLRGIFTPFFTNSLFQSSSALEAPLAPRAALSRVCPWKRDEPTPKAPVFETPRALPASAFDDLFSESSAGTSRRAEPLSPSEDSEVASDDMEESARLYTLFKVARMVIGAKNDGDEARRKDNQPKISYMQDDFVTFSCPKKARTKRVNPANLVRMKSAHDILPQVFPKKSRQ